MGCNCGKNSTTAASRGQQPAAPKQPPHPTGPVVGGKPMKGVTQAFTLTTPAGRMQSFGSRLEADAARVRAGGGTVS